MIAPLSHAAVDQDARLMARVRDGETELFDDLFQRNRATVAGLIRHIQPHGVDVEELTQRVFVQAFRGRHNYQPSARFTTWLYVIARNVVLNERRSDARRRNALGSMPVAQACSESTPVDDAIRAESRSEVRRAIEKLCPSQRQAIQLVFFQGFRYRAAGEQLDLTEKAVKSLIHRAKGNIKMHLSNLPNADNLG